MAEMLGTQQEVFRSRCTAREGVRPPLRGPFGAYPPGGPFSIRGGGDQLRGAVQAVVGKFEISAIQEDGLGRLTEVDEKMAETVDEQTNKEEKVLKDTRIAKDRDFDERQRKADDSHPLADGAQALRHGLNTGKRFVEVEPDEFPWDNCDRVLVVGAFDADRDLPDHGGAKS